MPQLIALNSLRRVMVAALPLEKLDESLHPTAVLFPAYSLEEIALVLVHVEGLARSGSVELCCVGPVAELLHDQIDGVLESRGMNNIVTTFHTDETDGCEYFLFAANAAEGNLLALIEAHPNLVSELKTEINE